MNSDPKNPRQDPNRGGQALPDDRQRAQETEREGGDDALSAAPTDARLDEKVIVNEQAGDRITNASEEVSKDSVAMENDDKI